MAYLEDKDLEFLGQMSDADLNNLVNCLIKDADGKTRWTEELTKSKNYIRYQPTFKHYFQYQPMHSMYWQEIAAEIQTFGANSIATALRFGKGVPYKEVVTDVAKKMKVEVNKNDGVAVIEQGILLKLLNKSLEKMDEDQLKSFSKEIGINNLKIFTAPSMALAFQAIFKAGGFKSYQLTLIIANAVAKTVLGSGLTLASNATLMRVTSLVAGPIGWALTGAWTAVDLAGPAFRVTIPAVVQVAALRLQHQAELAELRQQYEEALNS